MRELIRQEVHKVLKRAIELRHHFHQIPEKAFEEKFTARLIAQELRKTGVEVEEGLAGTGIVATIPGTHSGKVVALRADIDALNIEERSSKPYASQNPGYSHSCGHDGHIVCVLEASRILWKLRDHLAGSVRVIFQPAEETGRGAQSMVEAGALGNPLPSAIFTMHTWPNLDIGVVASKEGVITSGSDIFTIKVKGKGGHGARPYETISPILSAGRIAQALSDLTSYEVNGSLKRVVSIGIIHGGEQSNTIPDETLIKGTIRTLNEAVRREVLGQFKSTVSEICNKDKVEANIDIQQYCPHVYNHPDLYNLFEKTADDLLGPEKRVVFSDQSMGSEDFGFYTQLIPGLLIRLGMGKSSKPLHTGGFDFCDDSLESGIMILVGLVLRATESDFQINQSRKEE
ncbi:MAG: amidohydrolase [Deltaproteobacteria bacterium]|jgi:amidohydrolase|nr:amidohydrolase [Deltaproteobacteria bacterium]MCK5008881.1 amidohydrolase [Deltaproteobacteria bacterium]MCK5187236.1 amidohydrolase [Deltaproteobacteria bacterium]NOQ87230.1 amidohydrolase [Deltaproteobacteria bacterium]